MAGTPAQYAAPPLHVAPEKLDFGEAWAQPRFEWTLPITNSTDTPIDVSHISATCTCAAIEPRSLVIPPRETANVRLWLDLRPRTEEQRRETERRFSLAVTAAVRHSPNAAATWTVVGTVREHPLRCSPPELNWNSDLVAGRESVPQSCRVSCASGLREVRVHCDPPSIAQAVAQPAEGAAGEFMIDVWPATDLPPGKMAGAVIISGIASDGEALPELVVLLRGAVLPEFEVLPQTILLGDRPVGSEFEETITVRSRLGLPFRVAELGSANDDVQWSSGAEGDASAPSAQLKLRVRITERGPRSLALQLVLSDDERTQADETRPRAAGNETFPEPRPSGSGAAQPLSDGRGSKAGSRSAGHAGTILPLEVRYRGVDRLPIE